MRPRRKAAENPASPARNVQSTCSFNEAAAKGRGKLAEKSQIVARLMGFNEAAAKGRGKRWKPTRRPSARHVLQ